LRAKERGEEMNNSQTKATMMLPTHLWEYEATEAANRLNKSRTAIVIEALSKYVSDLKEQQQKLIELEIM